MGTFIKVLLVDDHELVRTGIRELLSSVPGIEVIGEAENGESAIEVAAILKPDVVLMDVMMPGMDGIEATVRVLAACPKAKIIVLTSRDNGPLPSRLMGEGASGYLTKSAGLEEMVQAIHRVHLGQHYLSSEVAQQLALKQGANSEKQQLSLFKKLSERELQVMRMIIHGQKVPDIAKELDLNLKTINTYRYRIFEKLKVKNDVELTHLAISYGMLDDSTQSAE